MKKRIISIVLVLLLTLPALAACSSNVYIPNTEKITSSRSMVTADKLSTLASAWTNPFKDVSNGDWFYSYVEYCSSNGLFSGNPDGTFDPQGKMTRAMFVTIFGRMAKINVSDYQGTSFVDCKIGEWYTPYVEWAALNSLVDGVGDNRFAPNAFVTREQMCTLLQRYADYADIDLIVRAGTPSFSDTDKVNSWALSSVSIFEKTRLVLGSGNGEFNPSGASKRCEVAALITRFCQMFVEENNDLCVPNNVEDLIIVPHYIYDFMNSPFSRRLIKDFADGSQSRFQPLYVTLLWKNGGDDNFSVLLSGNAAFEDALVYETDEHYVEVTNLKIGTRYYWKAVNSSGTDVTPVCTFTTASNQVRTLNINGVENTRDLGGFVTVDGKVVKQGLIFRSAKLDNITEEGADTFFNEVGIKTEIDLRSSDDGEATPTPILMDLGLNYINFPTPQYMKIFDHTDYQNEIDNIRDTFKFLADPDNYPLIFHCAHGTDRAGSMAFLILGLLGVDRDNLYKDHQLSWFSDLNYRGGENSTDSRIDSFSEMWATMSRYKDKSLPLSENIEAYLLDIGVTENEINTIRELLLEQPSQVISDVSEN